MYHALHRVLRYGLWGSVIRGSMNQLGMQ